MAYGNLGRNSKNRKLSETQESICREIAYQPFINKTIEDIANDNNITRTTIWRWKSLPEFNNRVLEIAKEIQRSHLPDFNTALLKCLGSKNEKTILKAIELYYKNQGLLKEVQDVTIKEENEITIDDLLKELEGL